MFFDEEMLLDLRLNIMDKYVDKFVITEATYMHNGKPKKLIFDINKFSKFKDKIIYIVVDQPPPDLLEIDMKDSLYTKETKKVLNASKRELYQIGKTEDGLVNTSPDDIIITSDVDEVPNLEDWGYGAHDIMVADIPNDQGGNVLISFEKLMFLFFASLSELYSFFISSNKLGFFILFNFISKMQSLSNNSPADISVRIFLIL